MLRLETHKLAFVFSVVMFSFLQVWKLQLQWNHDRGYVTAQAWSPSLHSTSIMKSASSPTVSPCGLHCITLGSYSHWVVWWNSSMTWHSLPIQFSLIQDSGSNHGAGTAEYRRN
jgi:hypothetical protein